MNIRSKLKVLAGVTLVGLGLLSLATVSGLKEIGETEETAHRRQAYAIDLVDIKAEALGTILLDPAADETKKIFADAEKTIERNGASAVATIRRAEVRDEFKAILAQWGAYDRASRELITLAQHDPKTANDRLNEVYEQRFKPFRAALEKFIAARQNEATQGIAQARTVRDKILWETVALLVVVVVANVFVVFNLSVTLQSALNGIREKLVPLRAGDLTQRLPDRSADELGEIAAGVNAFIDELQQIVQRTRALSDRLAETSSCFAQAAESVSQGSAEQSSATAAAAAAVEEFSVSIDQVADNAAQAKVRSDSSGDFSRRAGSDVLNAVSEIRHIETFVGQAAERMATLGQQARDISGIVDVIKEVADQTNLLALNAAIEAARAGEGGRGFAVVADEVRKLAERTSASAQEIVAMVTTIQTSTEEAHGMMRQTSELVVQGVRQIEQAGDSVQEINENSSGVVQAVGEISISLNEQRSAGTEIAASIERIAQMTEMGRNTASEVSETAKQLAQYADELQREVERFVV